MTATATTRVRAIKQAYQSNDETWGGVLNEGALDRLDDARGQWVTKALTGNYTLDVQNFIQDEARAPMLRFTGAGPFTVTAPAVAYWYIVRNDCTGDVTITPSGGTGAVIRAGRTAIWTTDGTLSYVLDPRLNELRAPNANVDMGSQKLVSMAAGTDATDGATLSNTVAQFAAPGAALAMNAQKITGVGAATNPTDAASLANRLDQFAAPTASVSMNSQKITSLANADSDTDAINRGQAVALTSSAVSAAAASASAALASETAAAGSASAASASALAAAASAANLVGTSTTSNSIGTGSRSFTTQADKFFAVGARLLITSDGAPSARSMFGVVTAYSGTALTVDVLAITGSGTYTDWTIRVSGERGATGAAGAVTINRLARTSNTALAAADIGSLIDITSGTFTQTFVAAATLGAGWWVYIRNAGTGDITLDPNSAETIDGLTSFVMYPGEVRFVQCDGTALRSFVITPFYRVFTASGTFTKPPGYALFSGLMWGGGNSGSRHASNPRGGGGSVCVPFTLASSLFGASETVTIGAGGAVYTGTVDDQGNKGGVSSIGSVIATLLSTGTNPDARPTFANGFGNGWDGGAGSTGNTVGGSATYGAGGGSGFTANPGASAFGGQGGRGSASGNGENGTAPGGGGGGCVSSGGGTQSGAGARGELRIWGII